MSSGNGLVECSLGGVLYGGQFDQLATQIDPQIDEDVF